MNLNEGFSTTKLGPTIQCFTHSTTQSPSFFILIVCCIRVEGQGSNFLNWQIAVRLFQSILMIEEETRNWLFGIVYFVVNSRSFPMINSINNIPSIYRKDRALPNQFTYLGTYIFWIIHCTREFRYKVQTGYLWTNKISCLK